MRVKAPQSTPSTATRGFGFIVLLLVGVLALMFHGTFQPGHTLFSNDGPLGSLMAHWYRFPEMFTGSWNDLNTVGTRVGEAPPSITNSLVWLLGPVGFSKFYALCALFILGASAWCCFRAWGLAPIACVLGALAAMLNGG